MSKTLSISIFIYIRQCSWLFMEMANHFLKHSMTLLDCTKAFDTCHLSTLFQRLLDRGMPAIVVRVGWFQI